MEKSSSVTRSGARLQSVKEMEAELDGAEVGEGGGGGYDGDYAVDVAEEEALADAQCGMAMAEDETARISGIRQASGGGRSGFTKYPLIWIATTNRDPY